MSLECLWFLFYEGKILLYNRKKPSLPYGIEPPVPLSGIILDVGAINGTVCRVCAITDDIPDTDNWFTVGLRETHSLLSEEEFTGPFYGLVAGFLEVGESLEDCAHREIMEETGIRAF